MSRWPALLRDPIFLGLIAASVFLGSQALAWAFLPMSGILAGGFLAGIALLLQQRRATPGRWIGLLASLVVLLTASTQTSSLLTLTLAGMTGLILAAAVQAPPIPAPVAATVVAKDDTFPMDGLAAEELEAPDEESDSEQSGELLQQWERRRLATGEEVIETTIKLTFAAGERAQTLHLPLHPPLMGIEHVHCEVVDGADLACDVDAIRAFGIRIAVRRRGACQLPLDSYVWVAVSASRASTRAA
ncbi:MAG: hypothetical protein KDA90_08220 [Planctomycetaceae bacterium]|nr:hypothetical protein [Planctomycetaceae bacterium]